MSHKGKPYRIKRCEEYKFPEYREALEKIWGEMGLDREFQTQKHVIKRPVVRNKELDESLSSSSPPRPLVVKKSSGPFGRKQHFDTSHGELHDITTDLEATTLEDKESKPRARNYKKKQADQLGALDEYEPPRTWMNIVSKHPHKTEIAKAKRRTKRVSKNDENDDDHDLDDEAEAGNQKQEREQRERERDQSPFGNYQCSCTAGCRAPPVPRVLMDPNLRPGLVQEDVRSVRSKTTSTEASIPFVPELTAKVVTAFHQIAACREWRAWVRAGSFGVSASGVTLDQVRAHSRSEPLLADLVDPNDGEILGAVWVNPLAQRAEGIADPSVSKELKAAFSKYKQSSVKRLKTGDEQSKSKLLRLASSLCVGLVFPQSLLDLLSIEPLVAAVAASAKTDTNLALAQLKHVL
jgi:hypothetical protein